MNVIIKGMNMPKNCRKCDFTHRTRFGQKLCTFLNEATSIKQKLPDCPVSKIPTPHGDLIDRDYLLSLIEGWNEDVENDKQNENSFVVGKTLNDVIRIIRGAHAVIEAEE